MRTLAIVEAASEALMIAGAMGIVPTPVEQILEAFNLKGPFDFEDQRLPRKAQRAGSRLRGKVPSMTFDDFVLVDRMIPKVLQRYAIGHEIGHARALPWQQGVRVDHLERDRWVLNTMEREADQFSTELLYQIDLFTDRARQHEPNIMLPLSWAPTWRAPTLLTVRRYVETSKHPIAFFCARAGLQAHIDQVVEVQSASQSSSFAQAVGPISNWLPKSLTLCRDPWVRFDNSWLGEIVRPTSDRLRPARLERVWDGRCTFEALAAERFTYQGVRHHDRVMVLLEL